MLALGLPAAAASFPQYSSRIWQTDDGLPQRFVQAIVQTRDGYLWVGTQKGFARFDGVRFVVFDKSNVPEMQHANIVGLHEARDGSLWVATGMGGVLRLKEGHFTHFGKTNGLAHDSMLGTICETRDGALWFATLAGLSRFEAGHFATFGKTNGLSDDVVRDMCEDLQGNLWIATPKGVDCWNRGLDINPIVTTDGLKQADTRAICCDREGAIWIGSGDGLMRMQNGKVTTFGKSNPYNMRWCLLPDQHGNLWVGSYDGLSRFADGKLIPQFNQDGLPFDLVRAVCEDREQNIWVGSRDGLIQLTPKRFVAYTEQQGLAKNNVISVLEDKAGTIWIGTWRGGINLLRNETLTPYTNRGAGPLVTTALYQDRAGRLWAGEDYGGGLYRLEKDVCRRFTPKQGLPATAIRAIFEDHHTNLWIGTSAGLYLERAGRFYPYGKEHGMGAEIVRAFCEDRCGNLWIGTEQGLWQMREETLAKFTTTNGLSNNAVIALLEDVAGNLWIGTAGGGLNRFRNGTFAAVTPAQGLFSDTICEILEDQRGWLWMSSPLGAFRVNLKQLDLVLQGQGGRIDCVAYGKVDGMSTELCNGVAKPGAWKSRDGRLWFATTKGVCVIDPNAQVEASQPPTVVVERIFADRKAFPESEAQLVTKPLRIPPGRSELEFHYTALSFRVPERNRFKYKLEGLDTDWVDAGTRRVAYYNNLHPGRYCFQVIACGKDGVWSQTDASAEIFLQPYFWQTPWFKLVVVAAIALLGFALHRLRLARVREVEALRLRIAADLHDEVGSNLGTISLLSRKVQKDGAVCEAGTKDLAAINRIAMQTANSIREIVWFINPEYDTMQDLVSRMREVAHSCSNGIECDFQTSEVDASEPLRPQFRQNFFLLFKEALVNAVKHSRASRVNITLSRKDHSCQLRVRDNGVGFDSGAACSGNGLKNMRLRAERLKGALEITSRPGEGTEVVFSTKIP